MQKLRIVSVLYKAHITHLILHVCDGFSLLIDVGDCFPVGEDGKHVFAILLQPMVKCTPKHCLSVLLAAQPLSPSLEMLGSALVVGSCKCV